MSDELAANAVNSVIRSFEELKAAWDGTNIDADVQRLLEAAYRDLETALDYLPGSFNAITDT